MQPKLPKKNHHPTKQKRRTRAKEAVLEVEVTEVSTAEVTVEVVETITTGPPHHPIAAEVLIDQQHRKGVQYMKDCQ